MSETSRKTMFGSGAFQKLMETARLGNSASQRRMRKQGFGNGASQNYMISN